jgi:hypothetical protein
LYDRTGLCTIVIAVFDRLVKVEGNVEKEISDFKAIVDG